MIRAPREIFEESKLLQIADGKPPFRLLAKTMGLAALIYPDRGLSKRSYIIVEIFAGLRLE
jgi:hypothetical protein